MGGQNREKIEREREMEITIEQSVQQKVPQSAVTMVIPQCGLRESERDRQTESEEICMGVCIGVFACVCE